MQQTITLIGCLTSDPHIQSFRSGSRLTRFRLGASRKVRKSDYGYDDSGFYGEDDDEAYTDRDRLFIDVECWGNLAENTHASLMKGKPVICVGYLNTQEWRDNSGNSHSKVILRAIFVGFELRNHVVNYRRNPLPSLAFQGADLSKYGTPAHQVSTPPQPFDESESTANDQGVEVVEISGVQLVPDDPSDRPAASF